MTTYNPVQKLTMLDRMSDFYWNNRASVQVSVVGFMAGAIMAAAALASL